MSRRVALAGSVVLAGAAATAVLAQAPEQQPPVFRSRIDLVHLDVSVLDRDRRPVRGLTAADFTILEDGKPQVVTAFAAVDVPDPPPPAAAWVRDVTPDVRTNEVARQPDARLFVILIDDAMIPSDLWAIQHAKKIGIGVIDRLSPIDQAAVVFSKGSGGAQDFTTDRARLTKAVESLNTGYAKYLLGWDHLSGRDCCPVFDSDMGLRQDSMRTLRLVAESLIAAPQRRKILVHVSPGITVDAASAAVPVQARRATTMAMVEANRHLMDEMPELLRRMQHANVTMYPVDPTGLGGLGAYVMSVALNVSALRQGGAPSRASGYHWLAPDAPPSAQALASHFSSVHMDFMLTAAEQTGGLAVVNTNEFNTGLDRVFRENGSYYLLGYQPRTSHPPGTYHRLKVEVNRPDLRVRTRTGYQTPLAEAAERTPSTGKTLERALAEPMPGGDLPMRIALSSVAIPGSDEAAVLVVVGLDRSPLSSRTTDTVEVQAMAFTPDGQRRAGPHRQTARIALQGAGQADGSYEILSRMALPPGRYNIRVGAARASDQRVGTVFADLDIPDVMHAPLSATEILIEASPPAAGGPKDAFAGLVPLLPTARREFRASASATAYRRIYQGGETPLADASLAISVLNDRGARVVEATGVLPASRFSEATRSLDHRFAIPLASLAPGQYLLSFEVKVGAASVTRHVRFTIV